MNLYRAASLVKRRGWRGAISRVFSEIWNRIHTRTYAAIIGAEVGPGAVIMPGARLRLGIGGRISIGRGTVIHPDVRILAYGGHVVIGAYCSVNPFSVLYGHGGLTIGDRVLVAAGTIIVPANHVTDAGPKIRGSGLRTKGIIIGDDVWLGAGVRILDGVSIADGVVVAAGCVVPAMALEASEIYGGVPARRIGSRGKDEAPRLPAG